MKKLIKMLIISIIFANIITMVFAENNERKVSVSNSYENSQYSNRIDFGEFSIFDINGKLSDEMNILAVGNHKDEEVVFEQVLNNENDEFLSYQLNCKSEYKLVFPESMKGSGVANNDGSYVIKSAHQNIGLITQLNAIDARGVSLQVITEKKVA